MQHAAITHPLIPAALLLGAVACGSQTPEPNDPTQSGRDPAPQLEGEAALDQYPERDQNRSGEYDPATETDAYMHRESADDAMMEKQCMTGECPEGP